jgi:YesN/AraC family two-component response regulator
MNDVNQELQRLLFMQREHLMVRSSYDHEVDFYDLVATGQLEEVMRQVREYHISELRGVGTLSPDRLKNVRYHLIISIAMIARYCINYGMDVETSYSLSDIYIQKCDAATSTARLDEIQQQCIEDYCTRMRALRLDNIFSKHVVRAIEYIYSHLQDRILVPDLSDYLGLNDAYFSKLFKKETGVSVSDFIRIKKIDAAKHMLKHSDHSCLSISQFLSFSTQSHFIQAFKKQTGLTPEEYRKQYFHRAFPKDQETKQGDSLPVEHTEEELTRLLEESKARNNISSSRKSKDE